MNIFFFYLRISVIPTVYPSSTGLDNFTGLKLNDDQVLVFLYLFMKNCIQIEIIK